jgi:hypothetical protein
LGSNASLDVSLDLRDVVVRYDFEEHVSLLLL